MNFSIQSRHVLLLTFACLVGLAVQARQSSPLAASAAANQLDSFSDETSDVNRMILIKYLKKAVKEMNASQSESEDDDDDEQNAQAYHRAVRAESKSNDRVKEFFIKRAMKNVALGFGKK